MNTTKARRRAAVGVADEVWVAAALLHRAFPKRADFTIREIVDRVEKEGLHPELRRGVYVHVVQHCVANRAPNPGRYRMLYETRRGHRRLFMPGDDWHPGRKAGRTRPDAEALPERWRGLLEWYDRWSRARSDAVGDPILALRGLGREIWLDQAPDEYVAGLRRGWE
jgi:hypothetical protein